MARHHSKWSSPSRFAAKAFLIALVFGVTHSVSWISPQARQETTAKAVLPFWLVGDGHDSILTVNNTKSIDSALSLILHAPDGRLLIRETLELLPREYRRVSVSRLLNGSEKSAWGSLVVEHDGHSNDIGLQLQVLDRARRSSFDVFVSERPNYVSNRLWAAARSDEHHVNRLMVNNSSNELRAVIIKARNADKVREEERIIEPRQTLTIELPGPTPSNQSVFVELFSEDTQPGDLSGGIFWQDTQRRLSGFNPLQDPLLRSSSGLTMAGMHGVDQPGFEHPLLLQNTTASDLKVKALVSVQTSPDKVQSRTFTQKLAPHEGLTLDLKEWLTKVRGPVVSATLDLEWKGPADGLIAVSHSFNSEKGVQILNPLVDPGQERKKVSNYVVRVGNGFNTQVQIKNPTKEPRRALAHLFLSDGREYGFGILTVPAQGLHVIDLDALRAEQIPDRSNRLLPGESFEGQLIWFVFDGPYDLIGRAVLSEYETGVASSFSCVQCGIFVPNQLFVTFASPESPRLPFETVPTTGEIEYVDCGNWSYGFDEDVSGMADTYTSSNTSVATVNSSGVITTQGSGTSIIRAYMEVEKEICQLATCTTIGFTTLQLVGSETITVQAPHPTNFTQTAVSDAGGGTLHFEYSWESTSGDLADLTACEVGEIVDYNNNDIPFPSPPFPTGLSPNDPTIEWGPATVGAISDNHQTPGAFVQPYSNQTVLATQNYRYRCTNINSNIPVVMSGPHNIERRVLKKSNGQWKFEVAKSGSKAVIDPLP